MRDEKRNTTDYKARGKKETSKGTEMVNKRVRPQEVETVGAFEY